MQILIYAVVLCALIFGCYQLIRLCRGDSDDVNRGEFFERGLQAAYYEASRMQQHLDMMQGCDSKFARAKKNHMFEGKASYQTTSNEQSHGHVSADSYSISQQEPIVFAEANV